MNNLIYLESLEFKLKSAEYHFSQTISAIHNNEFKNETEHLVAVSSEFTAMMLVLQSSLDILAQWVNAKLKLSHNSKYLDFNKLLKSKVILNQELENMLINFESNNITKYLRDYCNTVKHRNIIKIVEQPELYPSKYTFPSKHLLTGRQFIINRFKSYAERNIIPLSDVTFNYFIEKHRELIIFVEN